MQLRNNSSKKLYLPLLVHYFISSDKLLYSTIKMFSQVCPGVNYHNCMYSYLKPETEYVNTKNDKAVSVYLLTCLEKV